MKSEVNLVKLLHIIEVNHQGPSEAQFCVLSWLQWPRIWRIWKPKSAFFFKIASVFFQRIGSSGMNGCFTPFWGPNTHLEWAKLLFTEGPQLSHDTSSCQSPKNKPGYNSPDTPIRFHQASQITAKKCRLGFFIDFARQHTNEWKLRSGSVNLPQNPIFQSEWDKFLYKARFDLLLH